MRFPRSRCPELRRPLGVGWLAAGGFALATGAIAAQEISDAPKSDVASGLVRHRRTGFHLTCGSSFICRFARLVVDVSGLREIEINPLVAGPAGAVAVDARGTFER